MQGGGVKLSIVLITPVLIIMILVMAKLIVGLISLPFTRGFLPMMNQSGEETVLETAVDAQQYYEAMTTVLQRMVKERTRNLLAVLRYKSLSDKEFINEVLGLMMYMYGFELQRRELEAEFAAGTFQEMQDKSIVVAPDHATFMQIAMPAQAGVQRYWNTATSEPFSIRGDTYLMTVYSTSVIPSNVIHAYVATWVTLCELPFVKVRLP